MKPILFNTEMARAVLDGRKTCTRRIIKPQPPKRARLMREVALPKDDVWVGRWYNDADDSLRCPPYLRGDVLYVRETWLRFIPEHVFGGADFCYKADVDKDTDQLRKELGYKWKPSIHMPKEAARIFLRVTNVWAERLKDISADSAFGEGVTDWNDFARVWDSTVKPADRAAYGWNANPWVWVIEFERIDRRLAYGNENAALPGA